MKQQLKTRFALGLGAAVTLATIISLGTVFYSDVPGAPPPAPLYRPQVSCRAGARPEARANQLAAAARAKLERRAFSPSDGSDALSLLSEAVACREAAGDFGDSATASRNELRSWQQRLEQDYRRRRTRLARALDTGRMEDARRESHGLLAVLAGREDTYTTWLLRIERSEP